MDKIKTGDIVSVSFHNAQFTLIYKAEVLYKPCATGDSWHFKDIETGDIHEISEMCTVTKRKKEQGAEELF